MDCTARRRRRRIIRRRKRKRKRRLKSDDLKCEFVSSLVLVLLRYCVLRETLRQGWKKNISILHRKIQNIPLSLNSTIHFSRKTEAKLLPDWSPKDSTKYLVTM